MITVSQLPERPAPGVGLHCPYCWNTYSATKGDYFQLDPDHVMVCCENPLILVREKKTIEAIDPSQASA